MPPEKIPAPIGIIMASTELLGMMRQSNNIKFLPHILYQRREGKFMHRDT